MKHIWVIAFLGIVGLINFELTLATHEFPNLIPPGIYLILAGLSGFMFLFMWIEFRFTHRMKPVELLFIVMILYPVLANLLSGESLLISQLNVGLSQLNTPFNLGAFKEFQGMFYGASVGMIIYALYFFLQDSSSVKSIYTFIVVLVVAFVVVEVGYSLLVEWEKYVFVYQRFNDGARLSINSFTSNTNIYAFNLTMGIAGLGSLWISHPKLRLIYAPLGIIFAAAIVLTVSKTSMLAIAVYGGIYVAISLYFFLRKFPKTLVFIYATGLVGLTLFVTNLDQMNLPFLNRIYELMTTSSDRSFSSRVDIWLKGITMFQADNTLLGYGFGLSNTYLGVATAVPLPAAASSGQLLYRIVNDRFHNGFLEILVSYGLIGTLLLTIAHWEYFKALVNLTKRYWIAIPMWSLIISFAVQMMFEDRILFRPDLSGIFFMTMLILPLVKPEALSKKISTRT